MRHQDANGVLWENTIFFFLAQHKEYMTQAYAFSLSLFYTSVAICYIGNLQERSCVNEASTIQKSIKTNLPQAIAEGGLHAIVIIIRTAALHFFFFLHLAG